MPAPRSRPPAPDHGLDELRALADLRHRDPAAVHARATALLAGLADSDPARSAAHWVIGLADHELGSPRSAIDHFRAAVGLATQHRDAHAESLARASMAISLLSVGGAGAAAAADHEIARATALAPAGDRGLVELLAALVLQRTGRLDEAAGAYTAALARLRRAGDDANVARLLLNRGTLHAYQGSFADALDDLGEAERLATALELWVLVAMAAHNLGFTEGRRGDVPAALAAFERAEAAYATQGDPPRLVAALAADRCEVFLSVGLTRDAVAAARRALRVLGDAGDATHRSEARLLLARALLANGEPAEAGAEARAAAQAFRTARRRPWAAQAEYLALQAEILAIQDLDRPPPAGFLSRAQRIAALLGEQGWPVEALHVRTFVARVAIALGRPGVARDELARVAHGRRTASAPLRVETWHATALLRLAGGERAAAKRALRRGLEVLDEHRAVLGATELRAGATAQGAELARLGLRLALAEGRPWEVLRWAERWRAGALRLPPVSPPHDDALEAALHQLRDVRAAQREATLAGSPDPDLARRIAGLETAVRSRTMRATGDSARAVSRLDERALRDALGGTSLVELIAVEGRLFAVSVTEGRARLHDLAPAAAVAEEQGYLRFALRRVMAARVGEAAPAHSVDAVAAATSRLDGLLISPLELPDGPVVVVPTGSLHGLSWAALPSLAGRPITVVPSAELWHRRRPRRRASGARTVLVAGPGLPGGDAEVRLLAERYPEATVLRDGAATVDAVLTAMAGTDLVHLAAHGSFRSDSPLFSSLRLDDGPLTVYDLERLRSVPSTVVLPACDAAVADVQAGDELLGTAAAMLGLGVASVVAPVLPVPDDATTRLMLALHDGLRRGVGPSTALADAADALGDDPLHRAIAAAFICIGTAEAPT
jgi:tetratricopeptide (TPR) repeat protein